MVDEKQVKIVSSISCTPFLNLTQGLWEIIEFTGHQKSYLII